MVVVAAAFAAALTCLRSDFPRAEPGATLWRAPSRARFFAICLPSPPLLSAPPLSDLPSPLQPRSPRAVGTALRAAHCALRYNRPLNRRPHVRDRKHPHDKVSAGAELHP